jgi:hypothetical protein
MPHLDGPFWFRGWKGAPERSYPKAIVGLGLLREIDPTVCRCGTKTYHGYCCAQGAKGIYDDPDHPDWKTQPTSGPTVPLCLGCAMVAESRAAGRSNDDLRWPE